MKAKEFIVELADSSYDYVDHGDGEYRVRTQDGRTVRVGLAIDGGELEITVSVGGTFKKTDGRDQFRIVSTVMNIIKNELPKRLAPDVDTVTFTSGSDYMSRIRFYQKRALPLVNSILKQDSPHWRGDHGFGPGYYLFQWRRATNES